MSKNIKEDKYIIRKYSAPFLPYDPKGGYSYFSKVQSCFRIFTEKIEHAKRFDSIKEAKKYTCDKKDEIIKI